MLGRRKHLLHALFALKLYTTRNYENGPPNMKLVPTPLHTDNGSNFLGAKNDLQDFYKLMASTESQNAVHSFFLTNSISWPERAPHFGGLWEAAVKSAKHLLKRVVGQQRLTFEEFSTITSQVEACLNSRPLGALTSHSPDGMAPLTPGHFLIGRALQAYPESNITDNPSLFKRWNFCQAMLHHFWRHWSGE